MDTVTLLKQGLLYAHLLVFAIAVAEILRGDWRMLRSPTLDREALALTARVVGVALAGLWATGLGLVYLDTGFDPVVMAEKPKLIAKLIVVVALSANGALLHAVAFPMLERGLAASRHGAVICSVLGAVSTVSWLYAGFLGVGRIIAATMTLGGFLALYGLGLVAGIGIAVLVVAPLLQRRAAAQSVPLVPMDDATKWALDRDAHDPVVQTPALAAIPRGRRARSDRRVA